MLQFLSSFPCRLNMQGGSRTQIQEHFRNLTFSVCWVRVVWPKVWIRQPLVTTLARFSVKLKTWVLKFFFSRSICQDKPFNKNTLHALVGGLDFKGQAHEFSMSVFAGKKLQSFVASWSFSHQSLDGSLRHFLSFFRLPGEALRQSIYNSQKHALVSLSAPSSHLVCHVGKSFRLRKSTGWWRSLRKSIATTIQIALQMLTVHSCWAWRNVKLVRLDRLTDWVLLVIRHWLADPSMLAKHEASATKGALLLPHHASDRSSQSRPSWRILL